MPFINIDDSDLQYYYADSGPPLQCTKYRTLVLIHGHTFHSGTFQRLLPLAHSRSMRIICVNRREYPGTTPYSDSEVEIIISGSDEAKFDFLEQLGVEFCMVINRIIEACDIPKEGGITIAGWSMGSTLVLSIISSIDVVDAPLRSTLQAYITGFILWDPPVQALGAPDMPEAYIPLFDETIPSDQRGIAFATWVSSYFSHGNIFSCDISQLELKTADISREASVERMSRRELSSIIDITAKRQGDIETIMVGHPFASAINMHLMKALFDPLVRESWRRTSLVHLMSDSSTWNIIYASWFLQSLLKKTYQEEIQFKHQILPECNHFAMWDSPALTIDALAECMRAHDTYVKLPSSFK